MCLWVIEDTTPEWKLEETPPVPFWEITEVGDRWCVRPSCDYVEKDP